VEQTFQKKFMQYPFVKLHRIKLLFYKGQLCALMRLADEVSAKFVHFNISTSLNYYRKELGEDLEITRVIENHTREPLKEN